MEYVFLTGIKVFVAMNAIATIAYAVICVRAEVKSAPEKREKIYELDEALRKQNNLIELRRAIEKLRIVTVVSLPHSEQT